MSTQRVRTASPFEGSIGFCRAIRRGNRIHVSGTAPIAPDGGSFGGDAYEQAKRCFEIVADSVRELGGEVRDIVRTRMFITDAADWERVGRAHGEMFRGVDPAATMVVVAGLLDPEWLVEVEADAELE